MLRTLVILIALALIVMALKRMLDKSPHKKRSARKIGKMVQCAHCSIYIPEQEAIPNAGRYYCSQEHLEEDRH